MLPRARGVAASLKLLLEDPPFSAKKFHSVFMYRLTLKIHFEPRTLMISDTDALTDNDTFKALTAAHIGLCRVEVDF